MIIAVDIDGILTNETEGHDYKSRTPNLENIKKVNNFFELGNTIILYTARWKADREETIQWLAGHGVKYHTLDMSKMTYDMLIDDKAFNEFSLEAEPLDTKHEVVRRMLKMLGEDPEREGLIETPKRVVKSWNQLYSGYTQNPADIMTVFNEKCDEIVLLKDIELYSMCEHHNLPFIGKAHVAYLPDGKVVGISKLARLVEIYARRMQIQERIGTQVTDALMEHLKPKGAVCIIEAQHLCMQARGVAKQNSVMITSSMAGAFREDPVLRQELMQLIKG